MGSRRRIVHGTVDGNSYRAHFKGKVTDEDIRFLEEVVRAAIKKAESDNHE